MVQNYFEGIVAKPLKTQTLIFRDEPRSPTLVSLLLFLICGSFVDKLLVLLHSGKQGQ
jgi:hypothetical protein